MTVNDAIAFVRAKLQAIRTLPNNLVRQRQQLVKLRDAAKQNGKFGKAQDAQIRLDEASKDLASAISMNNKLDAIIASYERVKEAIGLGVFPVLPVAAGVALVAVAVTAGYLLKAYETRSLAIQALANGVLTPQQFSDFNKQEQTTGVAGMFSDVKMLVLLGIGAAVVFGVLGAQRKFLRSA